MPLSICFESGIGLNPLSFSVPFSEKVLLYVSGVTFSEKALFIVLATSFERFISLAHTNVKINNNVSSKILKAKAIEFQIIVK